MKYTPKKKFLAILSNVVSTQAFILSMYIAERDKMPDILFIYSIWVCICDCEIVYICTLCACDGLVQDNNCIASTEYQMGVTILEPLNCIAGKSFGTMQITTNQITLICH